MQIFKFGGASVKDAEGVKKFSACPYHCWATATHLLLFRQWGKRPMPWKQ